MKKYLSILGTVMIFALTISCSGEDSKKEPVEEDTFVRAADISFLPEIESEGTVFHNNGQAEDMLVTLKKSGANTIRIRLWKNPSGTHSGMAEVKTLANRARQLGLKIWLTVHFSDTWADPGTQTIPTEWQSMSFSDLKTAVSTYTKTVLTEINPDIFQIGNETNDGFLWPKGRLTQNESQFIQLLSAASATIRTESPDTKIMLHFAGMSGADWFFDKVKSVDYDYIGLSYYPIWHGKNLTTVKNTVNALGLEFNKKVLIAETAYPFTLEWNDFTNNIVGQNDQLISGISATPEGQKSFLTTIKTMMQTSEYGAGFSYWGGEWVAFRGPQAQNGSTFENQALYDFDLNALPVMDAFSKE
jgi:arabinogalactan endo-1,4-beta-galactosidase